jgi:predicted alpha/beta-fold hydrolase
MDFFLTGLLCHRWLLNHNYLTGNANQHVIYSAIESAEGLCLTARTKHILDENPYLPPVYCSFDVYGQLQTTVQFLIRNIGALYLTQSGRLKYIRELLNLDDGACIALDWVVPMPDLCSASVGALSRPNSAVTSTPDELENNIPIVVMHHGLCGDSNSEHVVFMVRRLLNSARKFRMVVVVARGCGGSELLTTDTMHGARTSDLRAAIKYIHSKSPNSRIFGMSFSLGAGIMLKYLGEEGEQVPLSAAVCLSPPWDGAKKSPFFNLWAMFLAVPVKLYAIKHRNSLKSSLSLWRILTAFDLSSVDTLLAASYGFSDLKAYYTACSPLPYAHNISVPTLAISARDDPVCFHGSAPSPSSPSLSLSSTQIVPIPERGNGDRGRGMSGGLEGQVQEQPHAAASSDVSLTATQPSLSEPVPVCRLVIVKTLLGGHLAFPHIAHATSSLSPPRTSPSVLSFPLSSLCNAWCDDVAVAWIETFLGSDTDSDPQSHTNMDIKATDGVKHGQLTPTV